MNRLANIKIGKKLAIGFGCAILLIACLTGLALQSVHAIHTAMTEAQRESRMATLSEKISANQGAIAQRVATMVVSREAGQEILTQLLTIRKDYMAAFDNLMSATVTEEDKRLVTHAEQAAAQWREADNRVIELLKAHKPAEAAKLHQEAVVPRFNELGATIAEYVAYRDKRLAGIDADAASTSSRATLLLIFFGLTSILLGGVSAIVLARSIVRPLDIAVS